MSGFFTRERFGRPQFLAGLLLVLFFVQAAWLVRQELHGNPDLVHSDQMRVEAGWRQWHGKGIAGAPYARPDFEDSQLARLPGSASSQDGFDREHSPLLPLISAAPLLAWPA